LSRLTKIYATCATKLDESSLGIDGKVTRVKDMERWLLDINKQVGRGSEFQTVAKEMVGYVCGTRNK
jgi:hypothetical protein